MSNNIMNWFAIYTKPRFEKKVYSLLSEQSIEVYLPLHKQLRKWSDRKKWIEEPLIKSYIFVRISPKEYYKVLQIPGVVKYVSFSGKAAIIRDEQIELLKRILAGSPEVELTQENLQVGTQVEISAGSLTGVRGELLEYKGNKKVTIRLEQLNCSLLLTIPLMLLRRIAPYSKVVA